MSKAANIRRSMRIQQWIEQVREYNQRPEGESMTFWCKRKGIPTTTFATRLHKVQELYLNQMETSAVMPVNQLETAGSKTTRFIELPSFNSYENISGITITCGKSRISVPENISEAFLSKLIGVISNVE